MTKVLFICHGNICRSPMAEFIFKDMVREAGLEDRFEVASAATSREEIDNDMYPPAKNVLRRHGIPFERRRAWQVTAYSLENYDYVVAMEEYNLSNLRRRFSDEQLARVTLLMDYTDDPRDVSDPWYSGDFETAYRDIHEGCQGLLKYLMNADGGISYNR